MYIDIQKKMYLNYIFFNCLQYLNATLCKVNFNNNLNIKFSIIPLNKMTLLQRIINYRQQNIT